MPTVARYALDVLTGNVPTGRLVFLAVERFLDDLENGSKRGLRFDQGGAVSIIKFFRDLAPFKLEPFQQFIAANLFGWKNDKGLRRFKTAYIEMGKGSGKTPFAAGIGIYGIVGDEEPDAEVYIAAPAKEQAAICFKDAVAIVNKNPYLKRTIRQHGCQGKMLSGNLSKGSCFMRPMSSEHKILDGPRPHIIIADELHEHANSIVLDKLTAGFKARKQPLALAITNSGWDRETICWYYHELSQKILEGVLENDEWFAYVCQLDACEECRLQGRDQPNCEKCDSWLDPDVWIKANPGLGTILQKEYLEKQVKEALQMAATENLKKRLNFCLWTQSESRAVAPEAWRTCAFEEGDPTAGDPLAWRAAKLAELRGKLCFGGLDLGVVNDFVCLAALYPVQPGVPKAVLLPWFWAPEATDQHGLLKTRVPYDRWVEQGFLKLTPGPVTDYEFAEKQILEIYESCDLQMIAYDRYNANELVMRLIQKHGIKMVEHGQGTVSMTYPIRELYRQIAGHDFIHGQNPILSWMIDNLVVKSDASGSLRCVKPENPNSPRKIDGAVAAIMAIGMSAAHPDMAVEPEVRFL